MVSNGHFRHRREKDFYKEGEEEKPNLSSALNSASIHPLGATILGTMPCNKEELITTLLTPAEASRRICQLFKQGLKKTKPPKFLQQLHRQHLRCISIIISHYTQMLAARTHS